MAEFKIENKKLSIEIFGVVYQVRKPKFKEIIEMEDSINALSSKEKFVFIKKNLVSYGVPEEVVDELDGTSISELLEYINGSKKN